MSHVSAFNIYFDSKTSEATLVFNTLSKGIALIQPALSSQLRAIQSGSGKPLPHLEDRERAHLQATGILTNDGSAEQAHFQFRHLSAKYGSRQMYVTIFLTENCNFACPYCYQDKLSSKHDLDMASWGTAFSMIRNQAKATGANRIYANLFGGEPLVNSDVALQAADDLRSLANDSVEVWISLPTNGSLLTDDIISRLESSIDRIVITLDGPESRHNEMRPFKNGSPSYAAVLEGIKACVMSRIPNINVRNNIRLEELDAIEAFAWDLPRHLPQSTKLFATFVPIAPPMSHFGDECYITDATAHIEAARLMAKAPEYGYQPFQLVFGSGECPAGRANSYVIGQDLSVFKCQAQMPDHPCARITPDGRLEVTDRSWYDIVAWQSECKSECIYGPICTGGCPIMSSSPDTIECPQKCVFDASLEILLRMQMRSLVSQAN